MTLTTGVDVLSSTTGNDTYAGAIDTWTALDVIDGGLGNDALPVNSATGTGVPAGATVTNVETIAISTAGAGYTIDTPVAGTYSGLTSLSVLAAGAQVLLVLQLPLLPILELALRVL